MNRPYQVKKKGLPASNRHAAVRQTKNADHKPGKKTNRIRLYKLSRLLPVKR